MAGFGDNFTPTGATRTTSVEAREHQNGVLAKRVCEVPNDLQQRFAYNGNVVQYIGYAAQGLAEGAGGWLIHKFAYDGQNRATSRKTANAATTNWTNRASETYT